MFARVWLIAILLPAPLAAAEIEPETIVGSVFGEPVKAGDVGLKAPIDTSLEFDARNEAYWDQTSRIMTAFGRPITERFFADRKFAASAEEIEAFQEHRLRTNRNGLREAEEKVRELRDQLEQEGLSEAQRGKLRVERASYERILLHLRDAIESPTPPEVAETVIVHLKKERELQRAYGGRVIFQQFGPEAVEARKRLFEEAEKKGDLHFANAGVRHLFDYYANMRHVESDPAVLEQPWFLGEGD